MKRSSNKSTPCYAARPAALAEQGEPSIGDRPPDECSKWGLFYFNPDDSAIFVEKRFGAGYTINMGNVWGGWWRR